MVEDKESLAALCAHAFGKAKRILSQKAKREKRALSGWSVINRHQVQKHCSHWI
jgi:hypothetical protein